MIKFDDSRNKKTSIWKVNEKNNVIAEKYESASSSSSEVTTEGIIEEETFEDSEKKL